MVICNFQLWQLSILAIFNFGKFDNLAIFNFDSSGQFGNLQFWQLSVLIILNLGYFQANFLNGFQEQHQQHIDSMDLSKKLQFQTILFPFSSPHFYATSCSLNIIIIRRNIIQQLKKEKNKQNRKKKEKTEFQFSFLKHHL